MITDGNLANASITSEVTILQTISKLSYTFSWVGSSPVGTIDVQVSNDYRQNGQGAVSNPGTWNSLTLSATPSISGNTGNGVIEIESLASYAIRVVYTRASGTGTVQCQIVGKVA